MGWKLLYLNRAWRFHRVVNNTLQIVLPLKLDTLLVYTTFTRTLCSLCTLWFLCSSKWLWHHVEFSLGPRSDLRLITHTNTLGTHNFLALCRMEIFSNEIKLIHWDLSPMLDYFINPSIKESCGSRTKDHGLQSLVLLVCIVYTNIGLVICCFRSTIFTIWLVGESLLLQPFQSTLPSVTHSCS